MSTKKLNKEELYKLPAIEIYKLVLEGKVLKKFPNGFWQQSESMDNAVVIIKYLIEDYLKLSDEELKEQLSVKLFRENKLTTMFNKCFNGSPYEVINHAYPNKFKAWEFKVVPQGFWDDEKNIIKATKWLIEDKLKLSDDELKEQLSANLFIDNGLRGMLKALNDSPYDAINLSYPNKFKAWEFKVVPQGFWDDEKNIIKATKWLIEDKLKLSDDELKEQLSANLFNDNGLGGMLKGLNGSPYEIINLVYANKFNPWEFKCTIMGYWDDKENRVKAIKWLIEDKLKLSNDELYTINTKAFKTNGLCGLLSKFFNGSPKKAIQEYLEYYNI